MIHNHNRKDQAHLPATLAIMAVMIAVGVTGRMIEHAPNFAPIAAMGLFAGYALFSMRKAYLLVIASMIISDAIIGFDSIAMRLTVYAALGLPVVAGSLVRSRLGERSLLTRGFAVTGSALASSILFFLITNFVVWAEGLLYPLTGAGLVASYTMALPFFKYTVAGDLFYSVVFFALYGFSHTFAEYTGMLQHQGTHQNAPATKRAHTSNER